MESMPRKELQKEKNLSTDKDEFCPYCHGGHSKSSKADNLEAQEGSNHCHDESTDNGEEERHRIARKKLMLSSALCLIFMIGEIIGGYLADSLAIMTDAAHLLTDFASFMISLMSIYLVSRPASRRMSFGWYRAEIMGALLSVLMIWLVTGILVYLAILRTINQHFEVDGKIMFITSFLAVLVNIIMMIVLQRYGHGHSHGLGGASHSHEHKDDEKEGGGHSHGGKSKNENLNVRAAFIHVVGDLIQAIGVMIAGIIIYVKPEYKLADPICTFIFSIIVLFTTIQILKEALNVLMEGTPKGIDFHEVKKSLYEIPGVVEIHNLRMWSLTVNMIAVSVHLAIEKDVNSSEILRTANEILRKRYNMREVTIQVEEYVPEMKNCKKCKPIA